MRSAGSGKVWGEEMGSAALSFDISHDVLELGLTGACFIISNVRNRASDAEFEKLKDHVVKEVLSGLSPEGIKNDPVLHGFRQLHEAIGVSNRKNVAASENLLKLLLKTGRFPRVSVLVDIYNLVSIKTRLSLGAHDTEKITGNVLLRLTNGTEKFWPIGGNELKPVVSGEYAYVDDGNDIICRLEVRQVEKTKVTLDTTECFYIVQGNARTDAGYIKNAAEELIFLTKRFCGGQERMLFAPW